MKNLKFLILIPPFASKEDFLWILRARPNLEVLHFCRNTFYSDHTTLHDLNFLNHRTPLTGTSNKLVSLDISSNTFINDSVLEEISPWCLNLEYLNITDCMHVTGIGVEAVVKLPHLKKLSMGILKCLTDDHLVLLAQNGNLTQLKIYGNNNITDVGCSQVLISCNDLELLDVSDCYRITDATVKAAEATVKYRINNKKLTLLVGGSNVSQFKWKKTTPMLTLDFSSSRYSDDAWEDNDYECCYGGDCCCGSD